MDKRNSERVQKLEALHILRFFLNQKTLYKTGKTNFALIDIMPGQSKVKSLLQLYEHVNNSNSL